jgi:hypothetical protein
MDERDKIMEEFEKYVDANGTSEEAWEELNSKLNS